MAKEGLYLCATGFQVQTSHSKFALYSNYNGVLIHTCVEPDPNFIFIYNGDLGKALQALYAELTNKD